MPSFEIRTPGPGDIDAIVDLSRELLQFYGVAPPLPRPDMIRKLKTALTGERKTVEILLAMDGEEPLGMVVFSEIYAVAICRNSLFIQDIFVTKRARGLGVGLALMRALAEIALQRGAFQIDWTADSWNEEARRFYEGMATLLKAEKIFYRLAGGNLRQFLDGARDPAIAAK